VAMKKAAGCGLGIGTRPAEIRRTAPRVPVLIEQIDPCLEADYLGWAPADFSAEKSSGKYL
jgi:hypothetical protein